MNTHPSLTSRVWAGWPSVLPLRPSVSFFTTGTPVPSICTYRIGNRLADDHGQVQLDGLRNLALLARGDVGANRLRRTLHRFGGHFQSGQNLHLLAARDRRALLAHHRLHAAHAGRTVPVLHVQFSVGGELAVVTVRTKIPGTRQFDLTQRGENPPGAQFPILCLMAAGAGQLR